MNDSIVIKDTYSYTDEKGNLLFQALRLIPKKFIQRRHEKGQWIYNLDGVRRVLYHLPEVIKSNKVFIVEGEKDVETLRKEGYIATTCPCGSSSWKEEYNKFFRNKFVYIIPDNDEAGYNFSKKVAYGIFPYAIKIKIVILPEQGKGRDITDWFDKGHTKSEFTDICVFETTELTQKDIESFKPKKKEKPKYNTNGLSMGNVERALQYPIENLIDIDSNGKALCVNHMENNPSMDTRNGFCYCYSCSWHGSVIDLYQKLHHCDFKTAVRELERRL